MENITLKIDPAPGLLADYVEKHGPSALASPEIAGPLGALGVARGYLPVSSVEDLIARWQVMAEQTTNAWYRAGFLNCIKELRAELESVNLRQPEENVPDEPRPKA